jgi:uncharacterized protein (TIGR02594 family)
MAANPFEIAQTMLGKGEVPDRATLMEFMKNGGANLDPVTTAWCAAFVNSSLGQAGMKGTGSNLARSFLDWGEAVDQPQKGDIAVFSRGDPNSIYGHVGFFDSYTPDGKINVLGGNQSNQVSLSPYDSGRLLGFRRAPGGGVVPASGPPPTQMAGTPAPGAAPMGGKAPEGPAGPMMPGQGAAPQQMAFGDVVGPQEPVSFGNVLDSFNRRRRQADEEEQARQSRLAALFASMPA